MTDATRALRLFLISSCVTGLLAPMPASAQVRQPTGEIMPAPTSQGDINIVISRGFPEDAVTLEGLFKYRGEMLDPVRDAKTGPGVFSPLCGFTGTLLLRGGACQVAFGWYNVTPGSTTPPPDDEIYELVPADTSVAFMCDDVDFCPLATMETTQAPQHSWTPMTFTAENIRNDPLQRYKGGLVGFALKGTPGSQCPQTKYSQAELNVRSPSGEPWITTLIYESTATPDAYYIAFEDLPLAESTWRGAQGGLQNDGDFNDFVYFITGLTCEGGGLPCDASATRPELKGVCAVGRTGCSVAGEEPVCNPVVEPTEERCDNLDNDCNGVVDDGDLCPENQVCDRGRCVESCSGGEFRCGPGLECNLAGFCVEAACKDVVCEDGQVCRDGVCSGGCDENVRCPDGQECQLGRCIDPCETVTCPDQQVCERGVCISSCECRGCPDGKQCNVADGPDRGRCVDAGCESMTCNTGFRCVAGACVDLCEGVVCPGGATCEDGKCGDPVPVDETPSGGSKASGGSKGGGLPVLSTGGTSGASSGAGAPSFGGGPQPMTGGNPGAGSGDRGRGVPESGCGCRTTSAPPRTGWLALAGFAVAATVLRRRRR